MMPNDAPTPGQSPLLPSESLDFAGCFADHEAHGILPARCFLSLRPITPELLSSNAPCIAGDPATPDESLRDSHSGLHGGCPPPQRASGAPPRSLRLPTTTLRPGDVSLSHEQRLAPGSILGRYRIDYELGHGGQATVYRAEHLILRTPAAIKVLHHHGHDAEHRAAELEALCEEARFAAMVSHPNVVRVSDVVRDHDRAWIVMDYIDGDTLATAIDIHGRLDAVSAVDIALDACHGLAAALDCGLIHRDVKPGNLLLRKIPQPNCRALLADFGLARGDNAQHSTGNVIAGTPAYMAPEQATDPNGIDHRADIYALGATLYHAVTGQPPYNADDPFELIHLHRSSPTPDPRLIIPDLNDELAALILAMLAKDRADRPADYRELDHLLNQVRDDLVHHRSRSSTSVLKRLKTLFHS